MDKLWAGHPGPPGSAGTDGFSAGPRGSDFDLASLRQAYRDVAERAAPMMSGRGGDSLTCISLTHRPGAHDRLADGLQSQFAPDGAMRYRERDFCCFNTMFADTYFAVVHRVVSELLPIGRMRLMIVPAGKVYRMHEDATKRIHLAIHTEPEAFIVGPDGCGYHVPPDGRLWEFDTRLRHTAFNAGTTDRVHLTMAVADSERPHHLALLDDRGPVR